MSCTNIGPFEGGLFKDPTLVNPEVSNGQATGMSLKSATLTESITIDAAVARQLAQALCPEIAGCIAFAAEEVAAVFKDCGGKAHVPDVQIPTCVEMQDAIAEAMKPVIATTEPVATNSGSTNSLPLTVMGSRDALMGAPKVYLQVGDYIIPAYLPNA